MYNEFKRYLKEKGKDEILDVIQEFEDTADFRALEETLQQIHRLGCRAEDIIINKTAIVDGSSGLYWYPGIGSVGMTYTITLKGVKIGNK